MSANGTLTLKIAGFGGVPTSGAARFLLNLTAIGPASTGYALVYPSDIAKPNARSLSYTGGEDASNLVTTQLGADGYIKIFAGSTATDFLVMSTAGTRRPTPALPVSSSR